MPIINPFKRFGPSPTGLGLDIVNVTPSNTDLVSVIREIRIGTAPETGGTLRVLGPKGEDGDIINFVNVSSGDYFVGPFTRIYLDGTNVSDIVGWV